MAVLYITEYSVTGKYDLPQEPPTAEQTVAIGAGSLQSNAFQANTAFVRLHADAICSVAIGANPTATAAKSRMAANTERIIGVVPGWKVAVITNT